jgi:RimJ/RimL family protein N-acetyltransferase
VKLCLDGERCALWVAARCDVGQFQAPYVAFGWERDGEIVGACVWNNWNGSNIELSIAGRGCVTRQAFRDMAAYAFGQLGCRRITMHTKASNVRLITQAKRNGFAAEGMRKDFYPDDDAVALVMLRSHCRW